jgi:hypothetical protein
MKKHCVAACPIGLAIALVCNVALSASRDVLVVATNDLGMHCACPGTEYFLLLPPFNTLRAQVIERGRRPRILDDPSDIRVEDNVLENTDETLKADPYFATWIEMSPKYGFGSALDEEGRIQGLTGATLDGEMHAQTGEGWWEVMGVPAFPDISHLSSFAEKIMIDPLFPDDREKRRNPYLTGNIKVFDQATNELLAETNTTVPVAFGGCCGCHLEVTADANLEPTPENSFKLMGQLHERDSGINIAELDPDGDGEAGPVRCSVCHWDPAWVKSRPRAATSTATARSCPRRSTASRGCCMAGMCRIRRYSNTTRIWPPTATIATRAMVSTAIGVITCSSPTTTKTASCGAPIAMVISTSAG